MLSDYKIIARVAKAHGKLGEVVAVPADGLPLLVNDNMTVAVVPPTLKGDRFHSVHVVSTTDAGQLLRLSGITQRGDAEHIVGRYLLARRDQLPADVELHDADALVGREVTDDTLGPLGRIHEVLRGPANDVWVLRGPRGEALLPVVDVVVTQVPEEGPIQVHAPAGTEFSPVTDAGE